MPYTLAVETASSIANMFANPQAKPISRNILPKLSQMRAVGRQFRKDSPSAHMCARLCIVHPASQTWYSLRRMVPCAIRLPIRRLSHALSVPRNTCE
jgi:hypothetical protein